jgi:glycosyltransferase involved in cell wall biosynthesis
MTPAVSVMMPVRNGEAWLGQGIASVLSQELADFELLIVDDGSGDGTPLVLEQYSRADARVRVIRQEPQGLVAALNCAIAAARAPYLARLDADDRAKPERLGRQHAFMQAHPELVLLGSGADIIDQSGAVVGRASPQTEGTELARILRRSNPFIHSTVMMRAAPVRKLGGYRAAFLAAEDYDLWLRMAELGEIANLAEHLIQYRRHAASSSRLAAVRQSFSARLARRSAAGRRGPAGDPARELKSPPDWWAPEAETSFFSDDVDFYRFLDSDAANGEAHVSAVRRHFFRLNHAERKLAQLRLKRLSQEIGLPMGFRQLEILALMAILHPPRALGMVLGREE